MAANLQFTNFPTLNIRELTYVETDYASGTDITVHSTQNFAEDYYLLVGNIGNDNTEIRKIVSFSGDVVTVDEAFDEAHNKFEPVHVINYNQLKVYRASNVSNVSPADADFTELATVDIDPDQIATKYTDNSGGSSYWYKQTFYNVALDTETPLADAVAVRGGTDSYYATLDNIRAKAGFNGNTYISDVVINTARSQAQSIIDSYLGGLYEVPFSAPVSSSITLITELLAAGILLKDDYGVFASGTTKDGEDKYQQAMDMLKALKDKKTGLIDGDGNPITGTAQVSGWPNDETACTEPENHGGDFQFRVTDKF